ARTIGRRVSTHRKIAFAKCWCDPAECKNQPSFVMSTSKFAPRLVSEGSTNFLTSSPMVSSKQINGATWTSLFVRLNTVNSFPALQGPVLASNFLARSISQAEDLNAAQFRSGAEIDRKSLS